MRAVTSQNREVQLVDAHEPSGPGVVVTVTSAGICGSDIHLVNAGASGVILGHEFGGTLPDGSLVAVRPTGECRTCDPCSRQLPQLCSEAITSLHGTSIDGGWADKVLVDPSRIIPMSGSVHQRDVALVEPLAVAVHGIRRSRISAGDRVLVIGAGSIGLVTVAALRHRGIEVDVVARHPHQRVAAEALGASLATRDGYDVVFDAVCTQEAVNQAVSLARPGGTILEFGLFWTPVTLNNSLLFKEISFIPSIFYSHDHSHDDFLEAAQVLAANGTIAEVIVTHRFGLDEAVRAYTTASDRASGSIKVHMHP